MNGTITTVGLISDTHGLLRPGAVKALEGVDMILHAGDIDNMIVLEDLGLIAPLYAVRGNMDFKPGVTELPEYITVPAGPVSIGVIHDVHRLEKDPAGAGLSAIVSGHTHKAAVGGGHGVLYINPGSAGPRRSGRPPSVGILEIAKDRIVPRIIPIDE